MNKGKDHSAEASKGDVSSEGGGATEAENQERSLDDHEGNSSLSDLKDAVRLVLEKVEFMEKQLRKLQADVEELNSNPSSHDSKYFEEKIENLAAFVKQNSPPQEERIASSGRWFFEPQRDWRRLGPYRS